MNKNDSAIKNIKSYPMSHGKEYAFVVYDMDEINQGLWV